MFDEMSGSGEIMDGPIVAPTMIFDPVMLSDEIPGQLYAYRVSEEEVILGNRLASVLTTSIGTGTSAMGDYRCVARNDNINSEAVITVQVKGVFDSYNAEYCTCVWL